MARGPRATITHDAAASPFASRGSERPIQMERPSTPPLEMLPGRRGRTPPRITRCSSPRRRLTRAMTDSHRAAPLTRLASGASTSQRPSRPLRVGSPSGRSRRNAAPSPSLSRWREELRPPDCGREGWASLVGAENARNVRDQQLATKGLSTPQDVRARLLHRLVRPWATWRPTTHPFRSGSHPHRESIPPPQPRKWAC